MKFTVLATAVLATFLPAAQADFDIFKVDHKKGGFVSVFDREFFPDTYDASGSKTGVRCRGACGFLGPTRDITQLEMNFRHKAPVYHWTIYKDRNYRMYGLDGKKYGDCYVTTGNDYDCKRKYDIGLQSETVHGYRKFHCKTSFTAGKILGL
ncbi:uncharacterized protein B0J16DRAFT_377404 [Fusarium flagelliforme]|uniref:uncharacterized protein n=1 Tax=Fusarium flagelliforme TaxID=2675880 RepID=UPI001E8CACA1|nr:uncharacterized protein B0J16DRAFT_377404 [Fusarium flagelliforme]KAH7196945.1 hypothetical protein B0J16DRAFT_377404 [Fusarium flagelliforme]